MGAEPFVLSILQHLLMIRDDTATRPEYYHLIDRCISQIVLQRGGIDPDFDARKLDLDVESILKVFIFLMEALISVKIIGIVIYPQIELRLILRGQWKSENFNEWGLNPLHLVTC